MASSASSTQDLSASINPHVSAPHSPSKFKKYGFAIAMIAGIGVLAVGVAGLAGYFHVGALSNMAQMNAIIMMAAGGGAGTILFIVGLVGFMKNRRNAQPADVLPKRAKEIAAKGYTVYGPEAYNKFNNIKIIEEKPLIPENPPQGEEIKEKSPISEQPRQTIAIVEEIPPITEKRQTIEIVGEIPPIPENLRVKEGERDPFFNAPVEMSFPLVYIPEKIRVNGEEMDLTLNNLKTLTGIPFRFVAPIFKEGPLFDTPITPGWRRISMDIIPQEGSETYHQLKERVENTGRVGGDKQQFYLPQALEVAIFMHLVYAHTGDWICSKLANTWCAESISNDQIMSQIMSVVVGGGFKKGEFTLGSVGFSVYFSDKESRGYGALAVWR